MATISEITRGLKGVSTVNQARIVINEAIAEVDRALRSGPRLTGDLRNSLASLESWRNEIANLPGGQDYAAPFRARSSTIIRAYVNVAGAVGEVRARQTVSLAAEFEKSARELPANVFRPVGRALGELGKGVGEAAGGLAGGIVSGLGPILIVVVALIVWTKFFRKA